MRCGWNACLDIGFAPTENALLSLLAQVVLVKHLACLVKEVEACLLIAHDFRRAILPETGGWHTGVALHASLASDRDARDSTGPVEARHGDVVWRCLGLEVVVAYRARLLNALILSA